MLQLPQVTRVQYHGHGLSQPLLLLLWAPTMDLRQTQTTQRWAGAFAKSREDMPDTVRCDGVIIEDELLQVVEMGVSQCVPHYRLNPSVPTGLVTF